MKTDAFVISKAARVIAVTLLVLIWVGTCLVFGETYGYNRTQDLPTPEMFSVTAEVSSVRYTGIPWDGYQMGVTVQVVEAERELSPGEEYELWLPSQTLEGLKEGAVLRLKCNGAAGKDIFCSDEYEVIR